MLKYAQRGLIALALLKVGYVLGDQLATIKIAKGFEKVLTEAEADDILARFVAHRKATLGW